VKLKKQKQGNFQSYQLYATEWYHLVSTWPDSEDGITNAWYPMVLGVSSGIYLCSFQPGGAANIESICRLEGERVGLGSGGLSEIQVGNKLGNVCLGLGAFSG
jgi:hypothetical protein